MATRTEYVYSLVPRKETYVHAEPDWIEAVPPEMLCTACKRINDGWFPRAIDVVARNRFSGWMPSMWWVAVEISCRNLVALLEPYLRHFSFGQCLGEGGRIDPKYVTMYHRPYILLHGDEYTSYRTCRVCKATWYNCKGQRSIRALRSDFAAHPIRQDSTGSLYVTEEVADIVVAKCFKQMKLIRIPLDDARPPGWTGVGEEFDYQIPVPWRWQDDP